MSNLSDQLSDLGCTPELVEAFAPYSAEHHLARVSRVDRAGAEVIDVGGLARATFGGTVLGDAAADRTSLPAVGDWVALRMWPDARTTIEAVLPRRTALVRDSAGTTSQAQALAANVDIVVVVEPLDPEPVIGRIERMLVLAWGSGAIPLVVLTKADLVYDSGDLVSDVRASAQGVDVVAVNAATADGVSPLRTYLSPGRTMALLGPSGAGKSSLINTLAGRELMPTGAVRGRDGRGRHTTKHRELIAIPGLGVVIDTPGLRAVGLVADGDAVADAFPDIEGLAELCRFRDCAHEGEPGCAVNAAVHDGTLSVARLDSWRKLRREAAFNAKRSDKRLRALARRQWVQRDQHWRHKARNGRP